MTWVVLHGGVNGSSLRRSESNRPFSRRNSSGSSSGGLNNQDWWVTGTSGKTRSVITHTHVLSRRRLHWEHEEREVMACEV
jgi:hypothetical protein